MYKCAINIHHTIRYPGFRGVMTGSFAYGNMKDNHYYKIETQDKRLSFTCVSVFMDMIISSNYLGCFPI